MPRIHELNILQNKLPTGKQNAITDVEGVAVGQTTVIKGDGAWQPGYGPFRTGVTVILPHQGNLYAEKVPAMVHTINGYGKVFGFEQVRELGRLETPIALTGTLNVPRVADALMTLAIEQNPYIGVGFTDTGRKGYASVNPVVGETSDGFLSDIQARPIGEKEVRAAIAHATTELVEEGTVGAGTGTSCFGWKGGIGTASRVLPPNNGGFTVGALVQSNYGLPEELMIAGVPIGQYVRPPDHKIRPEDGSIMIVLATDAPLNGRQLGRLCRRAVVGLARTGSIVHSGSGDFVIAFSTAFRLPDRPEQLVSKRPFIDDQSTMSIFALGVVEAVEEAIYNSLFMAQTVVGRDGNTSYALPVDEVMEVMKRYRRI